MIKGNKVYLTRDLYTPLTMARPLSLVPFCLKNLCYTVLLTLIRPGNKFTKISLNKNLKTMLYTLFPALLVFHNFRELLSLAL